MFFDFNQARAGTVSPLNQMYNMAVYPRVWVRLLVWLLCSAAVISQSDTPTPPDSTDPPENLQSEDVRGEMDSFEIYKRMFRKQRKEHVEAVSVLMSQDKYDRQYKLVKLVFENIFQALSTARVGLMSTGYLPGDDFPTDATIGQTITSVAGNIALFGDIILRIPDISHDLLKRNKDWDLAARWGTGFCNDIGFFTGKDQQLLQLMSQELGLVEKDPNYINPYSKLSKQAHLDDMVDRAVQETLEEQMERKRQEKKAKRKEKKNKGPRLSGLPRSEL